MALIHSSTVRSAIANLVCGDIDAGSTNPQGRLQMATSTGFTTILCTLLFSNPSFGTASAGVSTANSITADTNAANTGTAVAFRIIDRNVSVVMQGSVSATGGGGDIQLSSTAITAGDTVNLTSLTYAACP